jgi:hypothetical protein
MAQRDQITKQTEEKFLVEIDYKASIPIGASTVTGATVTAVKWLNTTPETKTSGADILISGTAIIVEPNRTKADFWIQNGTDNYTYQISVLATFNNGAILKDEVFVRVLNW